MPAGKLVARLRICSPLCYLQFRLWHLASSPSLLAGAGDGRRFPAGLRSVLEAAQISGAELTAEPSKSSLNCTKLTPDLRQGARRHWSGATLLSHDLRAWRSGRKIFASIAEWSERERGSLRALTPWLQIDRRLQANLRWPRPFRFLLNRPPNLRA